MKFVCKPGNFLLYFRTVKVSQVPGILKIYSAFEPPRGKTNNVVSEQV